MTFIVLYDNEPTEAHNITIFPPFSTDVKAMFYGAQMVNGYATRNILSLVNQPSSYLDTSYYNSSMNRGFDLYSYCDTDVEDCDEFQTEQYVQVFYQNNSPLASIEIYGHPYQSVAEAESSLQEDNLVQIPPTSLSQRFLNVECVYFDETENIEYLITKVANLQDYVTFFLKDDLPQSLSK